MTFSLEIRAIFRCQVGFREGNRCRRDRNSARMPPKRPVTTSFWSSAQDELGTKLKPTTSIIHASRDMKKST